MYIQNLVTVMKRILSSQFIYFEFGWNFKSFFPIMMKIVGTLGPKSWFVDVISGCLRAGMSGMRLFLDLFIFKFFEKHVVRFSDGFELCICVCVLAMARFDFLFGYPDYHQEALQKKLFFTSSLFHQLKSWRGKL